MSTLRKSAGMTLVEVLVSIGIVSIVALGVASVSVQMDNARRGEMFRQTVIETRDFLTESLNSRARWAMTTSRNPNMACLANRTTCSAQTAMNDFILYDEDGEVLVDYNGQKGFTINREVCDWTQSDCVFRYRIQWAAVCSGACVDPQVNVQISFEQNPGFSDSLSVSSPDFLHTVGADLGNLDENCINLGGQFNVQEMKCYLPKSRIDGGGSMMTCPYNQTADGPLLIAKGFNADGSVQCGALYAGECGLNQVWAGVNAAGSPICNANPTQPACTGGQTRTGCGPCTCPAGTTWDGVNCNTCAPVACAAPRIFDPLQCGCACPPGLTWDGTTCRACSSITAASCQAQGKVLNEATCQCEVSCTLTDQQCIIMNGGAKYKAVLMPLNPPHQTCSCVACPVCTYPTYCTDPSVDNCWCYTRDGCSPTAIVGPPYSTATGCGGGTVTYGTLTGFTTVLVASGNYRRSYSEQCATSNFTCAAPCAPGTYSAAPNAMTCNPCLIDTYAPTSGSASCTAVNIGQFAPAGSTSAQNCSNKPANSDYTGTGNGVNSCPFVCHAGYVGASCTGCPIDTFVSGGVCVNVAVGEYAPFASTSKYSCTNKPANSDYTTRGGGSDSCAYVCDPGFSGVNCEPIPTTTTNPTPTTTCGGSGC